LVIRGILAIALGVITFVWPGITLGALVLVFAAYAFIDGVVAITGAVRAVEAHNRWGMLLIEGIVGIAAAIIAVVWPAITVLALVYVIGAWALITGAMEVAAAVRLRQYIAHEWLLAIGGIASIILGFIMILVPLAGALVVAYWLGAWAFVFGAMLLGLGFRLRRWTGELRGGPSLTPRPAY
jgi:uncharacterized membrane protein HdeD (DUF308 family)